jgi:tetratricopeptide (TPR) repeat protein
MAWWFWGRDEGPPPGLTPEEARALVDRKNIALAELENANFDESFENFDAIAQALPQERLPVQNKLLGLLWSLQDMKDPGKRDAALQEATGALARLRELTDDAALLHFLEARLEQRRGNTAAAVAQLRQAAAADPQSVVYPAQIYDILQQQGAPEQQDEARAALETAWRLQPENLHLVREWSFAQARQRDPRLVETLEAMRRAYAAFFGTIQDQSRFDAGAAVDGALAAARSKRRSRR